jgi:hypothetical protein
MQVAAMYSDFDLDSRLDSAPTGGAVSAGTWTGHDSENEDDSWRESDENEAGHLSHRLIIVLQRQAEAPDIKRFLDR